MHTARLCVRHGPRLKLLLAHSPHRAYATFKEGDHVLVKPVSDTGHAGYLSKPLRENGSLNTSHGAISHVDILGKEPRAVIRTKKGIEYHVHECSLADYVVLSRRIVTPIYPAHANVIASLLELHPAEAFSTNKLEILEAGTGHGSLTLYLARAIHAANTKPPALDFSSNTGARPGKENEEPAPFDGPDDSAIQEWKQSRAAVLHTLDISERHSKHAQQIVRNFRRGLYYGNVDFHVGDLSSFFKHHQATKANSDPFLSHILLDMPSTNEQLSTAAPRLFKDGKLVVFNPSITQIVDCVRTIEQEALPLELERVIELPPGTAGGREWDVRVAVIRKAAAQAAKAATQRGFWSWFRSMFAKDALPDAAATPPMAFICRPKIGAPVAVGGFVGVWRKK